MLTSLAVLPVLIVVVAIFTLVSLMKLACNLKNKRLRVVAGISVTILVFMILFWLIPYIVILGIAKLISVILIK
jgi:hypothetical protein